MGRVKKVKNLEFLKEKTFHAEHAKHAKHAKFLEGSGSDKSIWESISYLSETISSIE